jgi:lysozyme
MAKRKKKTDKVWKIMIYIVVISSIVMLLIAGLEWWRARESMFVRYSAFGIEIPNNYEIHGIDVSKHQQYIDWESVGNMKIEEIKIGFAFIKATEGIGLKDNFFNRNWRLSKKYGITRGAYHFFLADRSGKEQAQNFISMVDLESGDLPPVVDIEQSLGVPDEKLLTRLNDFVLALESYYGVQPIIYTNVQFYKKHLSEKFESYPLWVAHYLQRDRPRIYRDWHFWQHSETGRVNGIRSKVDFNVFYGDSSEFKQLLIP